MKRNEFDSENTQDWWVFEFPPETSHWKTRWAINFCFVFSVENWLHEIMGGKNRKSATKTDLDDGRRAESIPTEPEETEEEYVEEKLDPRTEQLISRQTSSALLYLLFYSVLMFTLPFGSYFLTKHMLELHTDLSQFGVTAWSVVASVITIYIVIGLYAYHGYHEKDVNIDKDGRVTYGEQQSPVETEVDNEKKKPKQKKI